MQFELYQGSCLDVVPTLPKSQCVFADPFDNLNLGYAGFKDKMPDDEYIGFLDQCLCLFATKAPIVWFSFNVKWTLPFGEQAAAFLTNNPGWECKPCTQVFTFGQHNHHDLGNNHRPLWRFKHKDAPLYPDQIRVPSWRQRNGDKRADPRGRVPGDVFDMQYPYGAEPINWNLIQAELGNKPYSAAILEFHRAKQCVGREDTDGLPIFCGDVFDFPRVTGNSKQRCDWHPTQLAEDMVERCIKLSTKEGESVIDPFGGTGTTLRVCKKIGRSCTLVELTDEYCRKIAEANGLMPCKLTPNRWAA